jgi:hypothetical protein
VLADSPTRTRTIMDTPDQCGRGDRVEAAPRVSSAAAAPTVGGPTLAGGCLPEAGAVARPP